MTRATSRAAYEQLVASGALKGKQAGIMELVISRGPGTAAEILDGSPFDRNRNLARARFTELQARGLIAEAGARKCKVTGRAALVWEATDRTKPLDPDKARGVSKKTLAATMVRLCSFLEASPAIDVASVREAVKEARTMAARA